MTGTLFLVSGPSCAGKSPLVDALRRAFPALDERLGEPVLYNSRSARPDEEDGEDWHFRRREEIEALREDDRFLVVPVREDLQAVDLDALSRLLEEGDVLHEGNVALVEALLEHPRLADVRKPSVFLAPLSRAEIEHLRGDRAFEEHVRGLLRHRLMERTRRQMHSAQIPLPDLEDIERRVDSGWRALGRAHRLDAVVPCHDGEDSVHWTAFRAPIGDARRATWAVAEWIRGDRPACFERWPESLLAELR